MKFSVGIVLLASAALSAAASVPGETVLKRGQEMDSPGWRDGGDGKEYAVSRCEITDEKAQNGKMIKGNIGPEDKWCWLTTDDTEKEARVARLPAFKGPPNVGDDLAKSKYSCLTYSDIWANRERHEHGGCFHTG